MDVLALYKPTSSADDISEMIDRHRLICIEIGSNFAGQKSETFLLRTEPLAEL
jgi:hypothetical protein